MGSHYCHLKLDERRKLAKWLEAKIPISEIADRLGRDPSTIYRDIKRNRYTDGELPELSGYYALNAQDMYEKRRAIHRKMIVHPELKEAIEDRLKAGWSPEQIAGRMRLERHPIRVNHETIYRFAYSKDGLDEQFYRHLPVHRRRRRPRGYRRHNRTHILVDSQTKCKFCTNTESCMVGSQTKCKFFIKAERCLKENGHVRQGGVICQVA